MTEKSKQESEKSKALTSEKNKKMQAPRLTVISLILGLAALFAAGYSFKQAQMRDKSINQELLITNQSISELVDKQQEFKLAINKADESAKKQMETFENKLNSYNLTMKSMAKVSGKNESEWQLKKAQFYLQLAQINAHWSQQPQTTVDLLKQADTILADQHHPDIYDIRQQISTEIATVKKETELDIVGILTQLNTIQSQLQQLSYRDDPLLSPKSTQQKEQKVDGEKWRQKLANSVNALEKLVVIRHHKEPTKPILSDQQLSLVKEALYLDMQQAKWAVINQNQAVFKLAIEQALNEINRHFNAQQTIVAKLIKDLKNIQGTQLERKSFVPSKALMLINAHLQSSDDASLKQAPSGGKN